ncbi:type VII secretion integral membrane protein EccD [Saccharopolyspora kobensis]|uniref:Type VII secretion integral membrane protein EccD n=1 Tax=Saccharopolyspora kobensis TaxID=146035 RepID=A0A1H6DZZ0_9PSEU|nr:type VII secretion integral membrane protein EccD [Saccharopolyspora kobensis]SEG90918.1 type VII secretion integral membrane protein EccD [Saccharopolyspora kobensis]SFD94701.1 type VII secretion integral membrane protein EccD [Saccharopolyspora kobensis]
MSTSAVAGLCRLSIRAPDRNFDLAVPTDVPLIDLMPTIISYAGSQVEEAGLEHGGWVLQAVGGEPLDEESTPEALGLQDGETLYLRSRQEAMPAVHFDDLVDGVATGMQDRPWSWKPAATKRLLHASTLVAAGIIWLGLLLPGDSLVRAIASGVVAMLLLAASGSASRAVGDAMAGTAFGLAAVPYFALAGFLAPGPEASGMAVLLAASATAAGGAVLALAASGTHPHAFLGVLVTCAFGLITALLSLLTGTLAEAVSATALIAVLFGAFVPGLSFRVAGLKMPPLPTNADQLQEGIDPHASRHVLERAAIADRYMTSLYLAVGAVCMTAVVGLLTEPHWATYTMAGVLSAILLLHGRDVGGIWHRLSVVLPGLLGCTVLVLALSMQDLFGRLLVFAGVALVGTALMVAGWTVPGNRLVPYWGRAADILHVVLAVSLIPLMLTVLGVFGWIRAFNG